MTNDIAITDPRLIKVRDALEKIGCKVTSFDGRMNGIRVRISTIGFASFLQTVFGMGGHYSDIRYTPVGGEAVSEAFLHVGPLMGPKGSTLEALVVMPVA